MYENNSSIWLLNGSGYSEISPIRLAKKTVNRRRKLPLFSHNNSDHFKLWTPPDHCSWRPVPTQITGHHKRAFWVDRTGLTVSGHAPTEVSGTKKKFLFCLHDIVQLLNYIIILIRRIIYLSVLEFLQIPPAQSEGPGEWKRTGERKNIPPLMIKERRWDISTMFNGNSIASQYGTNSPWKFESQSLVIDMGKQLGGSRVFWRKIIRDGMWWVDNCTFWDFSVLLFKREEEISSSAEKWNSIRAFLATEVTEHPLPWSFESLSGRYSRSG